ncbi:MAG: hypothetical protein R3E89_04315 [Thiolinea sp.]
MRYSLLPDQIDALWGISWLHGSAGTHVRYIAQRGDARATGVIMGHALAWGYNKGEARSAAVAGLVLAAKSAIA